MALMPGWDKARAGWSTHLERFAHVFWFLWDDHDWNDLCDAATKLARQITAVHGDDAIEPSACSLEPT